MSKAEKRKKRNAPGAAASREFDRVVSALLSVPKKELDEAHKRESRGPRKPH